MKLISTINYFCYNDNLVIAPITVGVVRLYFFKIMDNDYIPTDETNDSETLALLSADNLP